MFLNENMGQNKLGMKGIYYFGPLVYVFYQPCIIYSTPVTDKFIKTISLRVAHSPLVIKKMIQPIPHYQIIIQTFSQINIKIKDSEQEDIVEYPRFYLFHTIILKCKWIELYDRHYPIKS